MRKEFIKREKNKSTRKLVDWKVFGRWVKDSLKREEQTKKRKQKGKFKRCASNYQRGTETVTGNDAFDLIITPRREYSNEPTGNAKKLWCDL